ncbi:MAG: competence/damage-inducible protein A, partial [Planctomycetes bacterium]|nr:competence/damage-inducible protein A [Planctomycetota bacterium]
MHAEVIAIGDELTTGQRLDTNSQWLSVELGLLGIPVKFHTTVCDTLEDGIEAFRIAAARSDLVVATGGLGPTADDLTRDVLAAVAAAPLEMSVAARADI